MPNNTLPPSQPLPVITPEMLKAMTHKPAPVTDDQMQALRRLIEVAKGDTGQSLRVARFLLAWWNAGACGGFDLTSLWSVDLAIAHDMQTVFGLIAEQHHYPDRFDLTDDFIQIVRQWAPETLD